MAIWRRWCVLLITTTVSCFQLTLAPWTQHDPYWCFYRWSDSFHEICYSVIKLFMVICYSVDRFVYKYTAKRVTIYILFVFCTSIALVYLAHTCSLQANKLLEYGTITNRLDEGKVALSSNFVNLDKFYIEKINLRLAARYFRYNGEYVHFKCTERLTSNRDNFPFEDHAMWRRNDLDIGKKQSHRYQINTKTNKKKKNGYFTYDVTSILEIERIDKFDYGVFSCYIQYPHTSEHSMKIFKKTCEFVLNEIPSRVVPVQIIPGSLMRIIAGGYRQRVDSDEITMYHTINGMDYDSVCTDIFRGCSTLLYLHMAFKLGGFVSVPRYGHFTNRIGDTDYFIGHTTHCICLNAYGHHEITFQRPYYNKTSRRNELIEITYPVSYLVTPRRQNIFPVWDNSSIQSAFSKTAWNCWYNDINANSNLCPLVKSITRSEILFFFLFENFIFCLGIFSMSFVTWLLYRLLFKNCIILIRNLILEGCFRPTANVCKDISENRGDEASFDYDVYISHDNSQENQAIQLTSELESRGFRVFCTGRDILCGDIVIQTMADAISKSRKIVLLLSPEYLEQSRNQYQLQLILSTVCGDFYVRNLLILKCQPCEVPSECRIFPCLDIGEDMSVLDEWIVEKPNRNMLLPYEERTGSQVTGTLEYICTWVATLTLLFLLYLAK